MFIYNIITFSTYDKLKKNTGYLNIISLFIYFNMTSLVL